MRSWILAIFTFLAMAITTTISHCNAFAHAAVGYPPTESTVPIWVQTLDTKIIRQCSEIKITEIENVGVTIMCIDEEGVPYFSLPAKDVKILVGDMANPHTVFVDENGMDLVDGQDPDTGLYNFAARIQNYNLDDEGTRVPIDYRLDGDDLLFLISNEFEGEPGNYTPTNFELPYLY